MKLKYTCDSCGFEHSDRYTMEFHEKEHSKKETLWYVDNKPSFDKATLEALVKEQNEEVPSQVLIKYGNKHAWYWLKWLAPWEDR